MHPSLRNSAILIVDDDERMLRAFERTLTAAGCQVTAVLWVFDAIETLASRQQRFDLVLTDLRMPFASGQSVLRIIKSAMPEIPVIIITAYADHTVKAECLAMGAAALIEKPVESAQLLQAIATVLETQRAAAPLTAQQPAQP